METVSCVESVAQNVEKAGSPGTCDNDNRVVAAPLDAAVRWWRADSRMGKRVGLIRFILIPEIMSTSPKMVSAAAAAEINQAAMNHELKDLCINQNDEENVPISSSIAQNHPIYIADDVSRALDTIEEILWKGNPMLEAHERLDIHAQWFFQEEQIATIEKIIVIDNTLDKKRCRLNVVRAAKGWYRNKLATVSVSVADGEAGWGQGLPPPSCHG
uniref:Uncharacterized protein n=1 Tax=Leersia perrieri TaxID=77586 RepID=A0A0D9XZM5_9ORYZ